MRNFILGLVTGVFGTLAWVAATWGMYTFMFAPFFQYEWGQMGPLEWGILVLLPAEAAAFGGALALVFTALATKRWRRA